MAGSVLEAFYLLIGADTSGLEAGAKAAKKGSKEIEDSLNSSVKVANKLQQSFGNLARRAGTALLAYFSASAISSGIMNAAHYADRLDELSKALDVNIEELDLWGRAVHLNGGTVESFQETVKGLTASLTAFATKGKSLIAPYFNELGVRMVDARGKARSFSEVLPEIADAFQKIGKQESFGLGQKIGLDQGTIMLLQQGRVAVEEMIRKQKELGVITKEDAEISAKFKDQVDYMAIAFRSLFITINATVLPILTKISEGIQKGAVFFRNHKDVLIGGIIGIASAITTVLLPALFRVAISLLPFVKVAAIVGLIGGAFALAYEDVKAFYEGNESLLGDLVKKYPELGAAVKKLEEKVRELSIVFKENLTLAAEEAKKALGGLLTILEAAYKLMWGLSNAAKSVKDFLGGGYKDVLLGDSKVDYAGATGALITAADANPFNALTSNSIANINNQKSNKNNVVNIDKITIETQATDADQISKALNQTLEQQILQALNDFDDGVIA